MALSPFMRDRVDAFDRRWQRLYDPSDIPAPRLVGGRNVAADCVSCGARETGSLCENCREWDRPIAGAR